MKVWASASAIGLSMAYFATACSSEPPTDGYVPPANGGTPGAAGSPATTSGTTGNPGGSPAAGGNGGTSPANGGSAGSAPIAGSGGAGGGTGGAGGGTGGGTGGTGVAGTCPPNVAGHCDAGAVYPTYPGYTLNLVEDFSTPLNLDTDPIWTWSDGSPADGQTGFRKEQITFADGNMLITAEAPAGCAPKTTNAACIAPRMSFAEALAGNTQANVAAMGVWSGELRTKYNNYRYGRYEVKMKAPIANPGMETNKTMSGDFLATMFIFRNPKNQVWNEIDVELEPNHFDELAGNVISVAGRTGYPGDVAGAFVTQANPVPAFSIYADHVYAFTWAADKVEWFIDGMSVHTETNTAKVPKLSAKIMMNLWVFSGDAFGAGVNNKFPFHSTYDWFRFYKSDAETKYPCAAPGCLDAADKTTSAQNNPTEMNYGQ